MSENIDTLLENQSLKKEFAVRNLDLSQVFHETPDNLERENRFLRHLLDWVQKYSELRYMHLLETLDEEFEIIVDGSWHLDGCTGYCPDCFQRPWCESGCQSCWPEDEEAGKMFLIDPVKRYLSPSRISLEILQKLQAEEDKKFEEFEKGKKDKDIPIEPISFDAEDESDFPF